MAEENGRLIGWLRYNLFWDSIPFLNMLYVLDGSRRIGYGKQLMEHRECRMKAAGYGAVMTSAASNEDAQHFYYHLGYVAIGGFTWQTDPYELLLSKTL